MPAPRPNPTPSARAQSTRDVLAAIRAVSAYADALTSGAPFDAGELAHARRVLDGDEITPRDNGHRHGIGNPASR